MTYLQRKRLKKLRRWLTLAEVIQWKMGYMSSAEKMEAIHECMRVEWWLERIGGYCKGK